MRGGVPQGQEVPFEVNADHGVPVVLAEIHQHPVAQEAGVADERVETSVHLQGGPDQGGGAVGGGDVTAVRDRLAAGGPDLGDDSSGRTLRAALPVQSHTQVVDDDPGAFGREGEGMGAAEPAAGPGDDDDPAVADSAHLDSPVTSRG